MISHFKLKFILSSFQVDLYMKLLVTLHLSLKLSPEYCHLGSSIKLNILSFAFLDTLFSNGNEAAYQYMKNDPLSYDVILMPLSFEGTWRLVVADHRSSYYKISYFDGSAPLTVPSFMSKVVAYFSFDFKRRYEKVNKYGKAATYVVSNFKKSSFRTAFSDIFVCQIAKSFVLNKPPTHFIKTPVEVLRGNMLIDLRSIQHSDIGFLIRNHLQPRC